jgi:hypothetical protein
MGDLLLQPRQVKIGRIIPARNLSEGIHQVLLFLLIRLVQNGLGVLPRRDDPLGKGLQEPFMDGQQAADRFPEGINTRLEPLEQKDPDQTAQVGPCPAEVGVGFLFLLFALYIMPQAVTGISELTRRRFERLPFAGLAEAAAQFAVKSLMGRGQKRKTVPAPSAELSLRSLQLFAGGPLKGNKKT